MGRGELKKDKSYYNSLFLQISLSLDFMSLVIKMFLLLGTGRGLFTWEFHLLFLGRKRKIRVPFLPLLFFKCF